MNIQNRSFNPASGLTRRDGATEQQQVSEAQMVVARFFDGWSDGTMLEVFEKYIAQSAVWYNSGLAPCIGKDAILNLGRMFYAGFPRIEVEHKVLLTGGNRVLSERVDHLKAEDGSDGPSIEVLGSVGRSIDLGGLVGQDARRARDVDVVGS